MSVTKIPFENHEQIRMLFGPKDQYLRLVRESLGVDAVLRGDELRLNGNLEQVNQAREIFDRLRTIAQKKRSLPESEVFEVLRKHGVNVPERAGGINLLERSRQVKPRTPGQSEYIRAIRNNEMVFASGPAGCGKTYLAVAMALNALRSEKVRRIVLVRPAVEAGEKLGFLPGDMLAKVNPFLRPLLDALNDMLDFEQVKRYMANDVIEVVPMAFMRGRTLNDTFMILDEGQNTTVTQMKMFLTRMGTNSRIVVTGDITQVDLDTHVRSGLTDAMSRLESIDGVACVRLTGQDIVRHRLVRDVCAAYDDGNPDGNNHHRPPKKG